MYSTYVFLHLFSQDHTMNFCPCIGGDMKVLHVREDGLAKSVSPFPDLLYHATYHTYEYIGWSTWPEQVAQAHVLLLQVKVSETFSGLNLVLYILITVHTY